MSMPGGFGAAREPTVDEIEVLAAVQDQIEEKLGKTFGSAFKAVQFTTQVVAGTNYLFKVEVDAGYLHVKVHKPLPHTGNPPVLLDASEGHELNTPLSP
jgi:cystatin-A/B